MPDQTTDSLLSAIARNDHKLRWELRNGCIRAALPNDPSGRTVSPVTSLWLSDKGQPVLKVIDATSAAIELFCASNRLNGYNPALRRKLLSACGLPDDSLIREIR